VLHFQHLQQMEIISLGLILINYADTIAHL